MTTDRPQVNVPQMCRKHQSLLVHQAGIPESGPWRALIIMAQIALFQAATADETFYSKIDGDLANIDWVGCLACFKPDAFGAIVDVAERQGMGAIKALGESWVKAKADK